MGEKYFVNEKKFPSGSTQILPVVFRGYTLKHRIKGSSVEE
jgi:hypothetical protein